MFIAQAQMVVMRADNDIFVGRARKIRLDVVYGFGVVLDVD